MGILLRTFGALGRNAIVLVEEVGHMGILVKKTTWSLPRMRSEPIAIQMIRFGIRAIPIVALVNFFVGMIVAVSMSELLRTLGVINWTAKVVSVAVTRELAPLMTAVVMSGFAGAAIAKRPTNASFTPWRVHVRAAPGRSSFSRSRSR